MSSSYRVVKLQKNRLYPTYQLHAFMANDKTPLQAGLRLAALTTLHWLKSRLGDDAPDSLAALPPPEEYLTAPDDALASLYLNQGHVVNVVSLQEKGVWSMQITEPDLGSDPGNPEQTRQAVPGRIIETNVAFQIAGNQLECGFKTVISDPVGTEREAEVYRVAVVRQLMQNPAFGLKQATELPMRVQRLSNGSQIQTMLWISRQPDNQMPIVLFSQPSEEREPTTGTVDLSKLKPVFGMAPPTLDLTKPPDLSAAIDVSRKRTAAVEPPFDLEKFGYYTFSHCRSYVLEQAAFPALVSRSGIEFRPGDVVVIYPTAFGGGSKVIPFARSAEKQKRILSELENEVKTYLKDKPVDFGQIEFLSGAREQLFRMSEELQQSAEASDVRFRQELEQIGAFWKSELGRKDDELEAVREQLRRQKEYASRFEDEKSRIREEAALENQKLREELETHLETIEFLRRKLDQPREYSGIAAWVEEHFAGRLILHKKAVERLEAHASRSPSAELICDALDYLATDYWEQRWAKLPKEIVLTRCAEKYGRPFEIKPVGTTTIEFTPSEYKIKYFRNEQGKLRESALDWHLGVGNEPENLLRIYFLHDDANRLIVVGSLPDHLRAVKIQ